MPGATPYSCVLAAVQSFDLALKLQDKKHGGNLADRQTGLLRKLVDCRRVVAEDSQ
jgi:hypothetical protein